MLGVEKHIQIVKDCVATFEELVAAAGKGDPSIFDLRDKVFDLENQADQVRRDLEEGIAEGAFFGGVREDILNLIGEIDSIANAAKDSARLLTLCTTGDSSIQAILNDPHMAKFLADLTSALTSMEALVLALKTSKKGIVAGAKKVEDFEEAADAEKGALLAELFKVPRTMDPVTVIQLRDFIFSADDIADNSVSASDVIIVLVAKGYG